MVRAAAACVAGFPASMVEDESEWRTRPRAPGARSPQCRIAATRWQIFEPGTLAASAETPPGCHVIGIALRKMDVRLAVSERTAWDGVMTPGTLFVTQPGVLARCLFRGPADELHLHVSSALVEDCADGRADRAAASLATGVVLTRDPMIERLARALLAVDAASAHGALYVDSIGTAIVARLLDAQSHGRAPDRTKVSELVRWRLKRAVDYIEGNLGEPVNLADLAAAAGLTRMHFAAQFRAATGLRPHEYLLRRRIERAQEMLAATDMPVVEVALTVGFQTQSHFTTVFKAFAGQPPHAWRLAHGIPASAVGFRNAACALERVAV